MPLLGIYPKEARLRTQKDTCSLFSAALFTIVKTWKKPEHPSTDKRIKKMCHKYTMERYAVITKDAVYDNMDGPRGCDAKGSKSDRERQIPYDATHMWNRKN